MIVKLLVFAVLCSSTQGDDRLCPTKNKVNIILYLYLGRLVQVAAECFNDVAVFWCTSELGVPIWNIRTRTGSSTSFVFRSHSLVGSTETRTLNSSSIVGQLTLYNGSFITTTATIMRPINLNGSTIRCNMDTLTLNIPANTGNE